MLVVALTCVYVAVIVSTSQALRKKQKSTTERAVAWQVAGLGASVVGTLVLWGLAQTSISLGHGLRHLGVALIFYFGALLAQKSNPGIDNASFAGLLGGSAFYFGREVAQTEMHGFIDWKGLLFPLVGAVGLFIVLHTSADKTDEE